MILFVFLSCNEKGANQIELTKDQTSKIVSIWFHCDTLGRQAGLLLTSNGKYEYLETDDNWSCFNSTFDNGSWEKRGNRITLTKIVTEYDLIRATKKSNVIDTLVAFKIVGSNLIVIDQMKEKVLGDRYITNSNILSFIDNNN